MRMILRRPLAIGFAFSLAACQPPVDDSAGAAEAARAADVAWAQTFINHDLEAGAAFMDSSGVVLAPDTPLVTGPAGYRELIGPFFGLPGFSGGWEPTTAIGAQSGELAYTVGTYELSWDGEDGNRVTDRGKYATVWRKQSDGTWKVALDMFNSDAPMPH